MPMKVGRRVRAALATAGAAILLSTSTVGALAVSSPSRNLNLNLPGRAPLSGVRPSPGGAMAWKIRGSSRQALWAAHALLGESAREEDLLNGSAIRSRLIVVSARVGAKRRVAILTNAITVGTLVDALGV